MKKGKGYINPRLICGIDIGVIIRNKRNEKNMSQTKLAETIGKSPQLICDIESGRKKPSPDTLIAIARELNISLDKIFLNKNYA